ncbi:hypothetical protein CROQUDRAFT_659464 [Cronartium quercuum f. sp. fusiforme G11]|uniref:Nudix hydrolase domain-containing protein n=1 Tax=Cronartium quercuum f. sp. fusiforme G11 TaxID=708437 RepID=A0A9P6TA39_9BASI|nr:hypothetical protein CROQUDRAFT_659464 [Cronartium quercuum f. sp. fusiforme G11]
MPKDPKVIPRQVAVAIPFRPWKGPDNPARFLLVSSRKHQDRWVFPKGEIEPKTDDDDPGRAALREAWEEGGIRGKIVRMLHRSQDTKPHKRVTDEFVSRAEYSFWLMEVSEEWKEWPEVSERKRKWVEQQEASDLVAWRADGQVEALEKILESELFTS